MNVSSVSKIQQISGLTERGLERRFRREVGISPRDYLSIQRFNNISLLFSLKSESLLQAALSVGYYDQSHFIKYCKKYTGMTPEKYFKNYDAILSGTYNF